MGKGSFLAFLGGLRAEIRGELQKDFPPREVFSPRGLRWRFSWREETANRGAAPQAPGLAGGLAAQGPEVAHLFRHQLELSFLPEALVHGDAERFEGQVALGLEERVGVGLFLLLEVDGIRFNLVRNLIGKPGGSNLKRSADLPLLEGEGALEEFAAADTRHATVSGEKIGGLGIETQGLGRRVEFLAGLRPFDQILRLGVSQLVGFLLLQLGDDIIADLFEGTLVGLDNLLEGQDHITAIRADGNA